MSCNFWLGWFPILPSVFSSAQETYLRYAAALNPCAGFWQEFTETPAKLLFGNLISGKPGLQDCRFPSGRLRFLPMSPEHNPWEPWLCFHSFFLHLPSASKSSNLLPFLGLCTGACSGSCCLSNPKVSGAGSDARRDQDFYNWQM